MKSIQRGLQLSLLSAPAFLFLAACTTSAPNAGSQNADANATQGDRAPAAATMTDNRMMKLLDTALFTDRKDTVSLQASSYAYQTNATQPVNLPNCQGSATLSRKNGTLQLTVSNPASCSNVFYDDPMTHSKRFVGHIANGRGQETVDLPEAYGDNNFHVILTSNSGKTTADINVHSTLPRPRHNFTYEQADFTLSTYLFGRRWGQLADCGGSVSLDIDSSRRAVLNFYNVEKCSNFTILTDNSTATNYTNQKLSFDAGGRGGQMVIPPDMYQGGMNSIKFIVKSDSEKTYDIVRIEFPATW